VCPPRAHNSYFIELFEIRAEFNLSNGELMIMNSTRHAIVLLAAIFMVLATSASAQWSQGGSMVYMGDLNLVASSFSNGNAEKGVAAPTEPLAANNTTENSALQNNNTTNETAALNSVLVPSAVAAEPAGKAVLDLSNYASDRTKNNLVGYTNIMYPISGSRGSTTSTSAGGAGCGGCG
jgi:hypothetical protein